MAGSAAFSQQITHPPPFSIAVERNFLQRRPLACLFMKPPPPGGDSLTKRRGLAAPSKVLERRRSFRLCLFLFAMVSSALKINSCQTVIPGVQYSQKVKKTKK
jgi:hypothetical protein